MKIKKIIKDARGQMTQAEFARYLGKSQGIVSKYENGSVSPPAAILEKCMALLQKSDKGEDISSENLAKRIRAELKEPQLAYARKTIATLLDGIQTASSNR